MGTAFFSSQECGCPAKPTYEGGTRGGGLGRGGVSGKEDLPKSSFSSPKVGAQAKMGPIGSITHIGLQN